MALPRATLLGAVIVLASSLGAAAADLYGGSMKDAPFMMPMEAPQRSFYMRLDGGYGSFDTPDITEDRLYDLHDASIDSTWSFGGGAGMYFGRGFRGDITVDRRFETDVYGDLAMHPNLSGARHFGLKSTVALANVYYDFDYGNRFTPYLGVGLGFTKNETTAGWVETCGCTSSTIEGGSSTHVAGAAMAGFNVKLRDRLSLDAGYRFLYLGEAATGPVTTTYATVPAIVSQDPTVENIHAHEFRFGLRYDIR